MIQPSLRAARPHLPHAARLHDEIVNLFNDRYFTEDKAVRAAELVRRHVTR